MAQHDAEARLGPDEGGLIRARADVVTTSRPNKDNVLIYYVKVIETEEIFELGEVEYSIWRQFTDGQALETAEQAIVERFGSEFRGRFRSLVAELAMRGLLQGGIPAELIEEFSSDPRSRQVRLQYQIDPDDRDLPARFYRFPLFEPNRPFALLARWFSFLKHAVWPIGFAALLGGLVLIKHSTELAADFPPEVLPALGIPHLLFTLLAFKLTRQVVLATVIRYYGATVRVFSLDILFGFWPRFHVDKRGLLRLARTPQLWAHASPAFARLAFFGFGALGWWWFRGDGTTKSAWCLVFLHAGLFELILSALPFRRGGKSETYYWFTTYFEEPFLRERAVAALRDVFSRSGDVFHLEPIERTALIAYGLSMIASIMLVSYAVLNLLMAWTGQYRGAGFAMILAICATLVVWRLMDRSRRQQKVAAQAEKQDRRRAARPDEGGTAEAAPVGGQ